MKLPPLPTPKKRTQGMNWISQHKRLAIYLRDGLACVYCGDAVENGCKLTLDHQKPYSEGGTNAETNLVTCCHKCNSSRGTRKVGVFVKAVAAYTMQDPACILKRILNAKKRVLPLAEAKALVELRGSCLAALQQN